MTDFTAAKMNEAQDKKFQTQYNYLIDLMTTQLNRGRIESMSGASWLDLQTGRFSFANGALTFDGKALKITNLDPDNILKKGEAADDINENATTIIGDRVRTGLLLSNNGDTWIDLNNGEFNLGDGGLTYDGSAIKISNISPSDILQKGSAASDVNTYSTTISGGKITTGTLTGNKLVSNTITADKIDVTDLSAVKIFQPNSPSIYGQIGNVTTYFDGSARTAPALSLYDDGISSSVPRFSIGRLGEYLFLTRGTDTVFWANQYATLIMAYNSDGFIRITDNDVSLNWGTGMNNAIGVDSYGPFYTKNGISEYF